MRFNKSLIFQCAALVLLGVLFAVIAHKALAKENAKPAPAPVASAPAPHAVQAGPAPGNLKPISRDAYFELKSAASDLQNLDFRMQAAKQAYVSLALAACKEAGIADPQNQGCPIDSLRPVEKK